MSTQTLQIQPHEFRALRKQVNNYAESMELLKNGVPIKKKNARIEDCFRISKLKPIFHNGNTGLLGHEIAYKESMFERAPSIPETNNAFIAQHFLMTVEYPEIKKTEHAGKENYQVISIPNKDSRLVQILNTDKHRITVAFKKGDAQAKEIFDAYIKRLIYS